MRVSLDSIFPIWFSKPPRGGFFILIEPPVMNMFAAYGEIEKMAAIEFDNLVKATNEVSEQE